MSKIEKIVTKTNNLCINITGSKVESLRINNDIKSTVRVYDKGFIGVEGKIGNADMAQLEKKAKSNLAQQIPYPETHDQPLTIDIDATKKIIADKDFVPQTEQLISSLAQQNPEFLFSNKVLINSTYKTYQNSDGTNLSYKGNNYELGLVLKYKGSANIMDEFYGSESDSFDKDAICKDVKMLCNAFVKQLPQIEEDEVIVISDSTPLSYILSHFIAEMYCNNASLLSGKMGQKVFSDKLNVAMNRDPSKQLNLPFFDAEGVVNKDYIAHLVQDGVMTKLITTKKNAEQYGIENLGSASAEYNSVPGIGIGGLEVQSTHDSLQDIIGKGKAVYLSVTSGGDSTPSGDISLPSQVSYLYENGKLVGKLPEFTVTGNAFTMFGENFLGVTTKGLFAFGRQKYLVYRAKLVNKA